MTGRVWVERLYVGMALAGLVGTWLQAFDYLEAGPVGGNVEFWRDTLANPASVFLLVDVFVVGGALLVLMFAEARRVGIPTGWVWGYLALTLVVAAGFAIPLFLAHRERRLRLAGDQVLPRGTGLAGVGFAVVAAVGAVAVSAAHLP